MSTLASASSLPLHSRLLHLLDPTLLESTDFNTTKFVQCEACSYLLPAVTGSADETSLTCTRCRFVNILDTPELRRRKLPRPAPRLIKDIDPDAPQSQPPQPVGNGRTQLSMLRALYSLPADDERPTTSFAQNANTPSLADWLVLPPGTTAVAAAARLAAAEASKASAARKAAVAAEANPPPPMPPPPKPPPTAPADASTETPSPLKASQNSSSGGSTTVGGARAAGNRTVHGVEGGGGGEERGESSSSHHSLSDPSGGVASGGSRGGSGVASKAGSQCGDNNSQHVSRGPGSEVGGPSQEEDEGQHDESMAEEDEEEEEEAAAEPPIAHKQQQQRGEASSHVRELLHAVSSALSAARERERAMSGTEWAWTYGRAEALRGARETKARCGGGIVAALLEEEAGRRLKRQRSSSVAAAGAAAQPPSWRLELALAELLERIGGEMATIVTRLSSSAASSSAGEGGAPRRNNSNTLSSSAATPVEEVAAVSADWCDLRPLRGDDEAPSDELAKFELWRQLALGLAGHRAALVFVR